MNLPDQFEDRTPLQIIVAGALYAGIGRGLAADVLAAHALGGTPHTVCTALVAAGSGRVTDVIEVPADSVDAQLEQILQTRMVDAAKVGVAGSADAATALFRRLDRELEGPLLLDLTLSGPSGEDLAGPKVVSVLHDHLGQPDLVTIRKDDAGLIAGMEIQSLDDAQVAAQRLHRLGARRVLLRCGALPARFFNGGDYAEPYYADLYYDGEAFALFESPALQAPEIHGASSALTLSVLKNLSLKRTPEEAIQAGKAYVTEALRRQSGATPVESPNYFWK